jgi:glycosyltransferase involved in cell wall biosynthesis
LVHAHSTTTKIKAQVATKLIIISANTSWYIFNFRRNLIRTLIDAGHRVLAIAPRDSYSARLQALGCEFRHIHIDQGGTNPFVDSKTVLDFYLIFRQSAPSAILNFTPKNNIYGTFAASLLEIPVINNIAGLGSVFIRENFTAKAARQLYRLTQKHARKIFFQNDDDLTLFLAAGLASPRITERLPGSGVDLDRFVPTAAPDDGVTRFLLIGRLLYDKGIKEYVEAAKLLRQKYPNTQFSILGIIDRYNPSAIAESTIDSWHAAGEISYLGQSDAVETHIAAADCVVLPSYYREGVPRSLLEAAAMAKPLVTTDNVGCRETVEDGVTGFLCRPRDVTDLCDRLEKVIAMSKREREAMGRKGRARMELLFDEKIVLRRYIAALAEIGIN